MSSSARQWMQKLTAGLNNPRLVNWDFARGELALLYCAPLARKEDTSEPLLSKAFWARALEDTEAIKIQYYIWPVEELVEVTVEYDADAQEVRAKATYSGAFDQRLAKLVRKSLQEEETSVDFKNPQLEYVFK